MTGISGVIETLDRSLGATGLFVRGGLRPGPDDGVPDLTDRGPARTVVLIGNAGGDLWNAFEAARAAEPDTFDPLHPLDRWLRSWIEAAAAEVGAHPIFPNDGPPFVPLLNSAQRAEPIFRSPTGIMIHPEFGLWHVYRAVLLFAEDLDVPARNDRPNPCETCEHRPCLSVCPVDAFEPGGFAAQRCADHVASGAGTVCQERGYLARRACPVGTALRYPRLAQAFHTSAIVEAVRRGYGAKS